jgi:hypothetical protein
MVAVLIIFSLHRDLIWKVIIHIFQYSENALISKVSNKIKVSSFVIKGIYTVYLIY